jgi:hypothetical protein
VIVSLLASAFLSLVSLAMCHAFGGATGVLFDSPNSTDSRRSAQGEITIRGTFYSVLQARAGSRRNLP